MWNFPHVLGAVDGKHIRIRRPRGSQSEYFNYKGWYSIVMLGACDGEKKFIYVDVGHEGRAGDSTIWKQSAFRQDIIHPGNPLNIPPPASIPGIPGFPIPYYFIGDDAFALGENLMKPLPRPGSGGRYVHERTYNYRLSRCRLPIENVFGILAARMRILQRCQDMEPEGVRLVVLAAVCLHNFLATEAKDAYMPHGFADYEDPATREIQKGKWREDRKLEALQRENYGRHDDYAKQVRKRLVNWVRTPEGSVPWQDQMI